MKQIFFRGDEVKHPDYGDGVVVEVKNDAHYPIYVKFNGLGTPASFRHDGRHFDNEPPTLTWRDGTQFDYGTPPERKWMPTEAHWAWILDYRGMHVEKRYIVAYNKDDFYPYKDQEGRLWMKAEPCDAPEWEGE